MPVKLPESCRILATRSDRIGDLVLSTPVFSALRARYPKAWIACLTLIENREIVDGNPFLNEVILYDKKGSERGVWGNLLFAGKLAQKKFDIVIHLHATHRMHLVTWLARIPIRIGWERKCASALTKSYPDFKKEGKKHEAEYNFDLFESLGMAYPENLETYFPVHPNAERSLEELLLHHRIDHDLPWIVLNPSASCLSKKWSAVRFGELVGRLTDRFKARFLAIGTLKDRPLIHRMQQTAGAPMDDLSGRLSLGMLGALLKKSAVLISNDSGPVHIAQALGTPVISIFGRKLPGLSPARWRPLGSKSRILWEDVGCEECLAHRCEINFLCLDAISVDAVLKETLDLLEASCLGQLGSLNR